VLSPILTTKGSPNATLFFWDVVSGAEVAAEDTIVGDGGALLGVIGAISIEYAGALPCLCLDEPDGVDAAVVRSGVVAAVDRGGAGLDGAVDGAVLDSMMDGLLAFNRSMDCLALGRAVEGDDHVISPSRIEALVAPVTISTPSILHVLDKNGSVGLIEFYLRVSPAWPELKRVLVTYPPIRSVALLRVAGAVMPTRVGSVPARDHLIPAWVAENAI